MRGRMATLFEYKVTILEHHLDSFGHVNNAHYLELYEQARWDFITKNGFGLERIRKDKKGPVLLEANLTFKKELQNRETITIKSQSTGMKNKFLMGMKQWMEKGDGQVASTLEILIGQFDLETRSLILPSKEWMSAIGEIPNA